MLEESHPLQVILHRMQSVGVEFDPDRVRHAYAFAEEVYGSAKHWTGIPMIEHVCGVAQILSQFSPDEDAIIACLIHHVLDSKTITLTDLDEKFGSKVRKLVSSLHLLSHIRIEGRRQSIEDLRLMLLTVSDDVRTILITLCDRRYLLNFLPTLSAEDRKFLCSNVLQLFAPVAARLGMYSMKHQMENCAFPVLYPHDAHRIAEQLLDVHREKGDFLPIAAQLTKKFLEEHGIHAEMEVREKNPYSIFMKMKRKSLTHVEQVHDLFALRVIVKSLEECYQVLGQLHRIGRPLSDRFKDFVAFPKPNGYQSLHTTLSNLPGVPEGTFIEVQVRTEQMNREAKFGIAAHWSYKEFGNTGRAMEKIQLMRILSEQQPVEGDGGQSGLADHIFVLSPRGDVFELPEGSTPLDFAFLVHTDLGIAFQAAKVNGNIVPLNHELQNGDVIEIQKRKIPQPSTQWMKLLRTASSRTKLKHYFYSLKRPQFISKGKVLVNAELKKHGLHALDSELSILKMCDDAFLTVQKREDLLMKIGQGNESASALLPRLSAVKSLLRQQETKQAHMTFENAQHLALVIENGLSMPTRFAKCCKAEEKRGQPMVGVVNRGGKVMVHAKGCRMMRTINKERVVAVHWGEKKTLVKTPSRV